MKTLFKGLLLLFGLLTFTNCQKDDEAGLKNSSSDGINVSTISFEQFKSNADAFRELQNAAGEGKYAKRVNDTVNGFFYFDSDVLVITYPDYKTYTVPIYRNKDVDGLYENFVIRENSGGTDSYIFKYNLSATDIASLTGDKRVADLYGKTNITKSNGDPIDKRLVFRYNGKWYHYGTTPGLPFIKIYIDGVEIIATEVPAPVDLEDLNYQYTPGSGGGGSSFSNIVILTHETGSIWPETDPGGPGGSGGSSQNIVITTPFVNILLTNYKQEAGIYRIMWLNGTGNEEMRQYIYGLFNGPYLLQYEQRKDFANKLIDFAMEDEDNEEVVGQILDYLDENDNSDESMQVVENILDYLDESDFSDESIEAAERALEDIINGDIPENIINLIEKPCQNQIVTDIINTSSPFTNVIKQTFGISENVNVQFRNGVIPSNGNAATNPLPIGSENNYTIDIKFQNTFLNSATDLSIVAATLHELVHAYLIDLYLKGLLVAENQEYQTLMNAFLNFYSNSNQITFNELDNEIHNAMVDFMQKMANSLYNYAQSKNMTNVSVDYCIALTWSTMQSTQLFQDVLTPQQQLDYAEIGYNEEQATAAKKGTKCP